MNTSLILFNIYDLHYLVHSLKCIILSIELGLGKDV